MSGGIVPLFHRKRTVPGDQYGPDPVLAVP